MTVAHLDESGTPCARHPAADLSTLLHLALIGSRAASYNHDVASKLQGVMMALDEIGELARLPDVQRAAETAQVALGELNQLLQQNRVLTKQPIPAKLAAADLVVKAAQRVGVTIKGTLPEVTVEVAPPLVMQALALAIDAVAGTERRRTLAPTMTVEPTVLVIRLPFAPTLAPNVGDSFALAAWALSRERGELRCGETELVVRLPVS